MYWPAWWYCRPHKVGATHCDVFIVNVSQVVCEIGRQCVSDKNIIHKCLCLTQCCQLAVAHDASTTNLSCLVNPS